MVWRYISQQHQVLRAILSGIGKTAVIYPITVLSGVACGTVDLGIIFFASETLGAGPAQIGLLIASRFLLYVTGCMVFRGLLSKYPPRYSILISCSLISLCLFWAFFIKSLVSAFILFGIAGIALALFWPPIMGWLSSDFEGKQLNKAMGLYNLCWSAGVIVSPLIAGWLGEKDPRLPIGVGAGLFLLNAAIVFGAIMALARISEDDQKADRSFAKPTDGKGSCFLRFPAWVGLFSCFALAGAIGNVFPLSGQFDLNMSKQIIGVLFTARIASQTLALGMMGRTSAWHFRPGLIFLSSIGFAALPIFMMRAETMAGLAPAFCVLGLFVAFNYSSSMFHAMTGSTNRTSRMAIHEALIASGLVVGSASGGAIYQWLDMPSVYLFCAALMALTACAQFIMIAAQKKRQTNTA